MTAINPLTDNILAAIAKLGGLNRAEAAAQGIDPAHFNLRGYQFHRVFTKAGRSFDDLAEALAQDGYPVLNELGQHDANVLLETLDVALSGVNVMTPAGLVAKMEAEQGAQDAHDAAWLDAVYADFEESDLMTATAAEQAAAALIAAAAPIIGEDQTAEIQEAVCQATADLEPAEYLAALESALELAKAAAQVATAAPVSNETAAAPIHHEPALTLETRHENAPTPAAGSRQSPEIRTAPGPLAASTAFDFGPARAADPGAAQREYADRIAPWFGLTAPNARPQPRPSLRLF